MNCFSYLDILELDHSRRPNSHTERKNLDASKQLETAVNSKLPLSWVVHLACSPKNI